MLFFYEDLRIDEDTKTLEIFFNFLNFRFKNSAVSVFQNLFGTHKFDIIDLTLYNYGKRQQYHI